MALYAIGDIQGCCDAFDRLLARLDYDSSRDRLWLAGDLVNRGPASLQTLRRARDLDAQPVLGNHDLHLLAVAAGARRQKPRDSFGEVLKAADRDELLAWLARQPLIRRDQDSGWVMVHAGLAPAWDLATAVRLAREVEERLARDYREPDFLAGMYGDEPHRWAESLRGMTRLRFIINAFTRLRFCREDGSLALGHSGPPGTQPPGQQPWFELWPPADQRVVFGHWAALGAGNHGHVVSLDSGCVWGARLTAVRLHPAPLEFFSVPCGAPEAVS